MSTSVLQKVLQPSFEKVQKTGMGFAEGQGFNDHKEKVMTLSGYGETKEMFYNRHCKFSYSGKQAGISK
jgi:hypothetical protein